MRLAAVLSAGTSAMPERLDLSSLPLFAQKHPAVCTCSTLLDTENVQAACINTPLHDHYI